MADWALQPGAGPADRPGERRDRLFLAHDALVEVSLHVEQLVHFLLGDGLERHAGPARDHFFDVRPRHVEDSVRLVLVALFELFMPPAKRDFLVVVGDRFVEVLPREGVFMPSTARRNSCSTFLISPYDMRLPSLTRAPASSSTSIALSGRKRSVMYRFD